MKELSIEEKAKAYDEALERAKQIFSEKELNYLFPELKEVEDERIRKDLLCYLHTLPNHFSHNGSLVVEWVAWLEKQGNEPNWCHHKVDLSSCSEEYRKAYYDGWNNCNIQHSQCKSESNDVVKCLINGMKFYYEDNKEATWGTEKFSMKVKDILSWLEKQGNPTDINPSEFDLHLNKLLKQFETLPKEELVSSLSFYLNVVQNDGTYKEEKESEQKLPIEKLSSEMKTIGESLGFTTQEECNRNNQMVTDLIMSDDGKGEQKPTDKIEPKFKVGDYIERKDGLGCHAKIIVVGVNVYACEKLIHSEDESPFFELMFKNQDEFQISSDFKQKPADKVEPFDMFEGLTDFERTLADICIGWIGQELGWKQYIKDNADVLLKIAVKKFNSVQDAPFEQNSAWSEEDEMMFKRILQQFMTANNDCKLHNASFTYDKEISFLKSIKDRVQPKQEWGEEDKKKLNLALYFLNESKQNAPEEFETYGKRLSKKDYEDVVNWLKSLRPQSTWKPSDKQLECLGYVIEKAEKDWSPLTNNRIYLTLKALKEQLEKL